VNCGPASNRADEPDVSRQYKELRIDMIRAHDYAGPVDIDDHWNVPKVVELLRPVPGDRLRTEGVWPEALPAQDSIPASKIPATSVSLRIIAGL